MTSLGVHTEISRDMQRYAENEWREVDEIFRVFALLPAQKFSFMVFC